MPSGLVLTDTHNRLTVIWIGMLLAIVSYAAVCLLLVVSTEAPADGDTDSLRYAFTGVGIGLGALSVWWRRKFLGIDAETSLTAERLQTHSVVVWALSDAVAVCGLVLGVVSHTVSEFVPFGFAAGALLLLHRPAALPVDRVRQTVG